MDLPEISITVPTLAEVPIICELGAETYRETFVGMSYYTRELIDGYTINAFAHDKIVSELADPRARYFLLRCDGAPAGYAKVTERAPADCVADLPNSIYLERLYFLRAFQRRGLGTVLLEASYKQARQRGARWLWLSVWEFNEPARTFYRKRGFVQAGEWDWPYESGGKRYVDRDMIMKIAVPAS